MFSRPNSQPTPRLMQVDLLRGIALGGILVVNLTVFTGIDKIPLFHQSGVDWFSSFAILFLFEGKFYPIFSFLFGWGIGRRQRAASRSIWFFWDNFRRMAILALLGLAHGCLFWQGDILMIYALIGMVLPLFRRIPCRILIPILLVCFLLPALFYIPGMGRELGGGFARAISPISTPLIAIRSGSASPAIVQRAVEYILKIIAFPTWGGTILGSILAGYLASSRNTDLRLRLRSILLPALLLNLGYAVISVFPNLASPTWSAFIRTVSLAIGGPLLALSYSLMITRWTDKHLAPVLHKILVRAGRMTLTLYLMQSLAAVLLFSSTTLISSYQLWLYAAGIYVLQLFFVYFWFEWAEFGPIEYAWRWLSKTIKTT